MRVWWEAISACAVISSRHIFFLFSACAFFIFCRCKKSHDFCLVNIFIVSLYFFSRYTIPAVSVHPTEKLKLDLGRRAMEITAVIP